MELKDFFAEHPKAALAFSGGVDSAYLLYAASQWGAGLRPYFVDTAFQPRFELADARRLCGELGVTLQVLPVDILSVPCVAANPPDRCYHCKKAIFSAIAAAAERDGYPLLLDGTNASDPEADRPGMRALRELEVRSPLRECGMTKDTIRRLSREAGLFTWDKPSYACLATRVPTGRAITREDLEKVERGEEVLAGLGFADFRLRLTPDGCKLQVREGQLPLALERREDILSVLEGDFPQITLDLRPRIPID